jgi:hypothetical protein
VGGALDECSADRIGGLRVLVDDFTINMMALPVAHLSQVNAAGRPYAAPVQKLGTPVTQIINSYSKDSNDPHDATRAYSAQMTKD